MLVYTIGALCQNSSKPRFDWISTPNIATITLIKIPYTTGLYNIIQSFILSRPIRKYLPKLNSCDLKSNSNLRVKLSEHWVGFAQLEYTKLTF